VDSEEDRGSTPLASSPESFRGCHAGVKRRRTWLLQYFRPPQRLRLGRPAQCAALLWQMPRTPTKFFYVYVLVSEIDPKRRYTGRTCDLQERLHKHNRGECSHTSKYTPWKIETAVAFRSEAKARRFERYLKTGSGREFARRHF
jgi:putative endonuclease